MVKIMIINGFDSYKERMNHVYEYAKGRVWDVYILQKGCV